MVDWVEFEASEDDICPIDEHLWCDIMMLDGEVWSGFAFSFSWHAMDGFGGEIVAYRLSGEQRGLSVDKFSEIERRENENTH